MERHEVSSEWALACGSPPSQASSFSVPRRSTQDMPGNQLEHARVTIPRFPSNTSFSDTSAAPSELSFGTYLSPLSRRGTQSQAGSEHSLAQIATPSPKGSRRSTREDDPPPHAPCPSPPRPRTTAPTHTLASRGATLSSSGGLVCLACPAAEQALGARSLSGEQPMKWHQLWATSGIVADITFTPA